MSHSTDKAHDKAHDKAQGTDTLIGRILDREASRDELARFESLADADARLWRTLAVRQIEQGELSHQVAARTDVADGVEAPAAPSRRRINWAMSLSGWAAVLLLGGAWWMMDGRGLSAVSGSPIQATDSESPGGMTYDQHLQEYMKAPFVNGEMDLMMLDNERLDSGGYRIRFLRRIEEWVDIDGPPQSIIDHRARIKVDPAKLRELNRRRKGG